VLTRSPTGIAIDGFAADGAVMSISPLQTPPVRPVVFTCTVRVLGVAPDVCDKTIQLFPHEVVFAVALKPILEPVLLAMDSV
jgi:hypothetical protein